LIIHINKKMVEKDWSVADTFIETAAPEGYKVETKI